jgi:SAM-dependent methyltransferase
MDIHAVFRIFQDRFRPRRMQKMAALSRMTTDMTVLDVGGSELNWGYSPVRPKLILLNVEPSDEAVGPQVVADGCRLPFASNQFHFVFSNSVIEHVNDHEAFAQEVARVGRKFYVQTPNKWFPIEPHLLAPFIHWFPLAWQRRLVRRFTGWGLIAKPSKQEIEAFLQSTHLLGVRELRTLFPGATLEKERVLGLTKSIIVWGN